MHFCDESCVNKQCWNKGNGPTRIQSMARSQTHSLDEKGVYGNALGNPLKLPSVLPILELKNLLGCFKYLDLGFGSQHCSN